MITIGLTGNIASGKSMVSRHLHKLGAGIIDADLVARKIVKPGSATLHEISSFFGQKVINFDGTLNRKMLGNIVFSDPHALEKLNQITHPKIRAAIHQEIEEFRKKPVKSGVLVIDAPLLIEVNLHKMVDLVWVVQVDESIQLKRLMLRDTFSEQEARQRIASQMPQKEKLAFADEIIPNNGSPEELQAFVSMLWEKLMLHI